MKSELANFEGVNFGMVDSGGNTIFEGDVVLWKSDSESVVCKVHWNPYSFAFSLVELNGTDPTFEVTNIRRQGEYTRLGNEEENPGIISAWKKLRGKNFGFFKQGEPDICFPLAAINACIGAGIEKAILNFKLLDNMIEGGECREWGGCVNERGALNVLQAQFDVEFVVADMEDVLENGGILTTKAGGFHACAVFVIDDQPYLVNSNIGEGEFVRPLLDVSEIPRSDDPEHHRDYLLVKG